MIQSQCKNTVYIVAVVLVSLLLPKNSYSDDSAVEITPQGLQFKKVKEISLANEELLISLKKIEVSLEFKNHSDKDITTEIAFPIPDYQYFYDAVLPDFEDFEVEVDSKKIAFETEVRAIANGEDCTKLLKEMNISIRDFGGYANWDDTTTRLYFPRLNKSDQEKLLNFHIADRDTEHYGWPLWTVSIKYHWKQIFPAHKSVTIKHRYTPHYGFRFFGARSTEANTPDRAFLMKDACLTEKTLKMLDPIPTDEEYVGGSWVTYILTSALNWKQPIRKFHLVIEKSEDQFISTCFGRLQGTNPNRYEATLTNFTPKKDLRVYFMNNSR